MLDADDGRSDELLLRGPVDGDLREGDAVVCLRDKVHDIDELHDVGECGFLEMLIKSAAVVAAREARPCTVDACHDACAERAIRRDAHPALQSPFHPWDSVL